MFTSIPQVCMRIHKFVWLQLPSLTATELTSFDSLPRLIESDKAGRILKPREGAPHHEGRTLVCMAREFYSKTPRNDTNEAGEYEVAAA